MLGRSSHGYHPGNSGLPHFLAFCKKSCKPTECFCKALNEGEFFVMKRDLLSQMMKTNAEIKINKPLQSQILETLISTVLCESQKAT